MEQMPSIAMKTKGPAMSEISLNSENNEVIIPIAAMTISQILGNAMTIIPTTMNALLIFSFMYDLGVQRRSVLAFVMHVSPTRQNSLNITRIRILELIRANAVSDSCGLSALFTNKLRKLHN
jgi:hypothetical protein